MSQIVVNGNNLDLLKKYPDNYFDAVVTDPPYGLGKEPEANEVMRSWIEAGYHEVKGSGFMGKEWDAFVPQPIFWKEVFRVLKHGGHVLAFYGTRTYDWGVMAMRFAGFEVRDTIYWHYGSGFPKSHNISKAIDRIYGAEREVIGVVKGMGNQNPEWNGTAKGRTENSFKSEYEKSNPATDQAKHWEGWGSALKPASEPIVLARKPLEKGLSIAENVLKWSTGGINIDGCRVKHNEPIKLMKKQEGGNKIYGQSGRYEDTTELKEEGRFPANLVMSHHPECECKGIKKIKAIKGGTGEATMKSGMGKNGIYGKYSHDKLGDNAGGLGDENGEETIEDWTCHEDCPIRIMDEQSGILNKQGISKSDNKSGWQNKYVGGDKVNAIERKLYLDTGGASRFFYCAKASKSERNRGLDGFEEKRPDVRDSKGMGTFEEKGVGKQSNFHPTVKPVKLMQYLVRLVTPANGKVLDPFCGSGTTGIACKLEGFQFVGMEQDAEYCKIAEARIMNWVEDAEEEVNAVEAKSEEPKDSKFTQTTLF